MISILNRIVEHIDAHLGDSIDIGELANSLGTTDYHARRMFSSLAGMPAFGGRFAPCMDRAQARSDTLALLFAHNHTSGSA